MSSSNKLMNGAQGGTMELQMPEMLSRTTETKRRVEPILDASGTLRRHVLSKLEEARTSSSADDSTDEKPNRN